MLSNSQEVICQKLVLHVSSGSKHQETDESTRPKWFVEEEDLIDKAIPTTTKYKNKWAVTIFK